MAANKPNATTYTTTNQVPKNQTINDNSLNYTNTDNGKNPRSDPEKNDGS